MTTTSPTSPPKIPWPRFALLAWALVAFLFLAVYTLDLRLSYPQIAGPCEGQDCHYQAITTTEAEVLTAMGLSVKAYAFYILGITVLTVIIFVTLAVIMLFRLYPQGHGFLFSLMLIIIPATTITSFDVVAAAFPAWTIPIQLLFAIGQMLLVLFFLVFPNGRLFPRWSLIIPTLIALLGLFEWGNEALLNVLPFVVMFVSLLVGIISVVVYRYRRLFNHTERQQTKWVIVGMLIFILGFPIWGFTFEFSNPAPGQAKLFWILGGWTLTNLSSYALPMAITISILRFRLWDIDLIIRRTLIYGALTGTLAVVYFISIVLLQRLLPTQTQLATILSTLAIAALFSPLRARIQRDIDRLFYRRRYNTEQTLAVFNATLRQEVDLEHLSASLLTIVEDTMQPEGVSLWLKTTNDQ